MSLHARVSNVVRLILSIITMKENEKLSEKDKNKYSYV